MFRNTLFLLSLLAAPAIAETASSSAQNTNIINPKLFGDTRGSLVDKSMNPAISVNALVTGARGNFDNGVPSGLALREVEAAFTAAVDPYFLGNIIINKEAKDKFVGVEEAYFLTLGLPYVTLKGGKFRSQFGKDNPLHTHALPLIDHPLSNRAILGEDGVDSIGLEASVLVPVPWYLDLTVGGISANGVDDAFGSPTPEKVAGTARLTNLFDLSDTTTLEVGGSAAAGDSKIRRTNRYFGADLTLKYRSGRGKGDLAIAWVNEFLHGTRDGSANTDTTDWEKAWGLYSSLLVRFYQRTWIGARFDYLKYSPTPGSIIKTGENLMIAYVPSEFSAIQLQGGLLQTTGGINNWVAMVQYNMTIGSHPAHAY